MVPVCLNWKGAPIASAKDDEENYVVGWGRTANRVSPSVHVQMSM